MLLLFEDWKLNELVDRPDLGVASLLASLKASNYQVKLVLGQSVYLKAMLESIDELSKLFSIAKSEGVSEDYIYYFENFFEHDFSQILVSNFHNFFKDRVSAYLEVEKLVLLEEFLINAVRLYKYFLEKECFESFKFLNIYKKEIELANPTIACFSVHSFDPFTRVLRRYLKEMGIPVIIGGPITHYLDCDTARVCMEEEFCDYIVIGPGEVVLVDLISCLQNDGNLEEVSNLIYKNYEGKICLTQSSLSLDINNLPFPDFSDYNLDDFFAPVNILPIQSSRGCSWQKCTFCAHHKSYQRFQMYNLEYVIAMIKRHQEKYGCKYFAFHDEELSPFRLSKISRELLKGNFNGYYYCYARFSEHFSLDIFQEAHSAGFRVISWGLESGSSDILKRMNKGFSLETAQKNLIASKEAGIKNICWIMFGFPGETDEDREKTIEFLKTNRAYIDHLNISSFQLNKRSPIAMEPENWNIVMESNDNYRKFYYKTIQDQFNSLKVDEILNNMALGVLNLTADYKYLPLGNLARMFMFFLACHRFSGDIWENVDKIYPVLIGDRYSRSVRDYSKSFLLNRLFESPITNDLSNEFLQFLDGTNTLSDVLKTSDAKKSIQYLIDLNSIIFLNQKMEREMVYE